MGQDSKIEWTHHTFNPWIGCTKVSDGCKNCYAESLMDHRYKKTKWGPNGLRVIKADSGWRDPIKWDKLAAEAGERHRVFCASLADVCEGQDTMPADAWEAVQAARLRLGKMIDATPNLDWLILTKRPQNIPTTFGTMFTGGVNPRPNIWWGTSVEDSRVTQRIVDLCKVQAAVRFLSLEPLIGPLDLSAWLEWGANGPPWFDNDSDTGERAWVIVGGESGSNARPFNVGWARSIIEQCKSVGVPVFCKQLGTVPVIAPDEMDAWPDYPNYRHSIMSDGMIRIHLRDGKGGDWNEWPDDLRVREFPIAEQAGTP